MPTKSKPKSPIIIRSCKIMRLPEEKLIKAAATAIGLNHFNAPPISHMRRAMPGVALHPSRIAVMTKKYWGLGGVKLTVGFMDDPPADLRKRLLRHMNAWGKYGNVVFVETKHNPQVRISRSTPAPDDGYWSYEGTDILHIDEDEPTMNLDGFTMKTPDSEFYRVVRHETGHTLGFPHEHMRTEIINKIDVEKAIAYFKRTEGWKKKDVIEQVLTPIENSALMSTEKVDPQSVMCYWLPGTIMKDRKPVVGGTNIDAMDARFVARIYPKKRSSK